MGPRASCRATGKNLSIYLGRNVTSGNRILVELANLGAGLANMGFPEQITELTKSLELLPAPATASFSGGITATMVVEDSAGSGNGGD